MQRKDILKGKVYRAKGGLLVRVTDTASSPVEAEVYDFISQTYIKEERGVKPADLLGPVGPLPTTIVDASETLNNAHDTRQLLAQIDAFNEAFKTEAEGPNRVQTRTSIYPIKEIKVRIPVDGYGRAVEALALPPKVGEVSIPGDEFIRFTISHGVPLVAVPDLTVGGYPGLALELLTTDNVNRIKAEQEVQRERRSRSFEVANAEREVLKKEVADGVVPADRIVGNIQYGVGYRNHPDLKERLTAALVNAGLEEYVDLHAS